MIEILVVLGIIAMVLSFGVPAFNRITSQQISSAARKFSGTIRTIRNDAILLNRIHRLVVDFEEQRWWVEEQKAFTALTTDEEGSDSVEKSFSLSPKYSKEPVLAPKGVEFSGTYLERDGMRTEGLAYIHFFPNGYADPSVLFIKKAGSSTFGFGLEIKPVNGKVEITRETVESFKP